MCRAQRHASRNSQRAGDSCQLFAYGHDFVSVSIINDNSEGTVSLPPYTWPPPPCVWVEPTLSSRPALLHSAIISAHHRERCVTTGRGRIHADRHFTQQGHDGIPRSMLNVVRA